jgi:hypothetical protein
MRRSIVALSLIISTLFFVAPEAAQASVGCEPLSTQAISPDGLTVSVSALTTVEKTGSNQLNISYRLLNQSTDKKIDEGSFTLFFSDGTVMAQYGFFGSLFPSDSIERSYQWEFLKNQVPAAIQYDSFSGSRKLDIAKLHWAMPGKSCPIITYDSGATLREVQAQTLGGTCLTIGEKKVIPEGEMTCTSNLSSIDQKLASGGCQITANGDLAKEQSCLAESYKGKVIWKLTFNKSAAADKAGVDKAAAEKAALSKKITITCVKAKLTKKVTGVNPKCPSGYKRK